MKNFLLAFLIFLLWSFFGVWLYSWLNPTTKEEAILNVTTNSVLIPSKPIDSLEVTIEKIADSLRSKPNVKNGLQISDDNGKVLYSYDDSYTITKNSVLLDSLILKDSHYKIASYLLEHPTKEVHILSLYSPTEKFSTPNIGIKRGQVIKSSLKFIGIKPNQIKIKPIIKELEFSETNTFSNGINFIFSPLTEETLIKEIVTKVKKTVYPQFSTNGILVNKELQELLDYTKQIVAQNAETKIKIIGHTDNVGNGIDNYKLGMEYAMQVRWYLINKGNLNRKNVKALSKGEEEPIDTNASAKGRKNNARIEVVYN